jgi:4-nitrophenyl phosphatase
MTAWAIDLDGVMWRGSETIPGSAQAVDRLRRTGSPVAFVTNSSQRTPAQVAENLARHGVPDAEDLVVTSAQAAAELILPDQRVVVVGSDGIRTAVEERQAHVVADDDPQLDDVDAVVVGVTDTFDYRLLTRAMIAIRAGARFVATNDDPTIPIAGGRLLPGNGALAAAVATASGVTPIVAGKPHETIAHLVRRRLGGRGDGVARHDGVETSIDGALDGIMVGDRPETDGLFAAALGFRFGLVLTGVVDEADLPVEPAPDKIAVDLIRMVVDELG